MTSFLQGLIWLLGHLPKVLAGCFSQCVALLAAGFARKELRQLRKNVSLVLGLPAHTAFAKMFYRQVYRHQSVCLFETLKASYDPTAVELRGWEPFTETLQRLDSRGNGVVVVTGHIGSWEILTRAVADAVGKDLSVLAKPARYQAVTRVLESLRQRFSCRVLWIDRKSIIRDMLAVLKQGNPLGFVMDQKPVGRQGVSLPFLGHAADFVGGPAKVAKRQQSPVAAVFCLRRGPWEYELICEEIPYASTIEEDDLTALMVRAIEKRVREYPEQWTWNYKRWTFA